MTYSLPITSLTAIAAGILLLILTSQVIRLRRRHGVVLGDNGDRAIAKAIRGQANAAEQLPMALILMGLAEMQGAPAVLLILMALTLLLGRIMHGYYFAVDGVTWRLRFWGMLLTLIAQGGLILALVLAQAF